MFPKEIDNFATLPKIVSEGVLGIMISKDHPEGKIFVEKFNAALKKTRDNGTIKAILKKYNVAE